MCCNAVAYLVVESENPFLNPVNTPEPWKSDIVLRGEVDIAKEGADSKYGVTECRR